MLIIVTHATSIDGKIYEAPTSTLVEILKSRRRSFTFLRHSIDGKIDSVAYEYDGNILISKKRLPVFSRPAPLRYISEAFSTFWFFSLKKDASKDVYVGVDPLNAFAGILLKKFGRMKKVVFYTADYSRERFENKILNFLYHAIDRFCVRNADEVWSVSSRICAVRRKQGLSEEKNVFVPNVPSLEYEKHLSGTRKDKFSLISLGIIGEQLDYIGVFDAITELKNTYPDLSFKVIGNGPKEAEYKTYVTEHGLDGQVKFLGYLDHTRALEEISNSGIGLALYNGKWSFNHFGDSMKCREYFCFGLPILTTDTHSTVEEIVQSGAGIVCDMRKEDYINAITRILRDYDTYSMVSRAMAQKYDAIHSRLLNKLDE